MTDSVIWVGTQSNVFGTAFHGLCGTEETAMNIAKGILSKYFKDEETLKIKLYDLEMTHYAEIKKGFGVVIDWMPVFP